MAWIFTIPQIVKILSGKTGGLTLILYVIVLAYMALGFSLAVSSYKVKPEKIRKQTVIIFFQWSILVAVTLIVAIGRISWRPGDTITCIVILVLSVVTILHYRNLTDPFCRGFLAIWCKSGPQLWFTYTMISQGTSEGFPLISIIAGNLTSMPRLAQVWLSGHKAGWDRPTKGLFMGEFFNVLTWGTATVVWIIFQT
jgi:hypothetical protein